LLPEDGNIFDQHINRIESEVLDLPDQSEGNVSEDQYTDHLSRTFVPRSYQTITEEEDIRQSLQHDRSVPSTVMWPTRGQNPINKFNTEGYLSCAFPTLFPSGAADFLSPRLNRITIGNYCKHLLLYHDGHFAKHCRFRYFALNTGMLFKLDEFTYVKTLMMIIYLLKSCVTW